MEIVHNKKEFTRIYNKYFDSLYKFIFVIVKNPQDTADICQDVFYKLFVTDKNFLDDEHIKAWLFTCSKNASVDFFRKKEHKNSDIEKSIHIGENMYFDETLPVIQSLDQKYRECLILHYYEGYKTDEIAKILGTANATIRIRLKRARALLKNKLKGSF
ncbi:MAG: RNA polymerase sigma factor [Clostridia bacterium]